MPRLTQSIPLVSRPYTLKPAHHPDLRVFLEGPRYRLTPIRGEPFGYRLAPIRRTHLAKRAHLHIRDGSTHKKILKNRHQKCNTALFEGITLIEGTWCPFDVAFLIRRSFPCVASSRNLPPYAVPLIEPLDAAPHVRSPVTDECRRIVTNLSCLFPPRFSRRARKMPWPFSVCPRAFKALRFKKLTSHPRPDLRLERGYAQKNRRWWRRGRGPILRGKNNIFIGILL